MSEQQQRDHSAHSKASRLTSIAAGQTPEHRTKYVYDAAGNLKRRGDVPVIQDFNVNNLNELTTSTNSFGLTVFGTTTGPATNVTVNTSNAVLYADSTFGVFLPTVLDGLNTFTAVAKDAYGRTDSNTVTTAFHATNVFAYDLNGNMLTNGSRYFDYDDENQLIRVTEPKAWKSEFAYDGKMRRRIRKEYTWLSAISGWQLTNEVRYVYEGNVVIQERDANNLPEVTYTRGRDLSGSLEGAGGIGGLLARTDNSLLAIGDAGAHAYYHSDGSGNITALIDSAGALVAKYMYDPFGNILASTGPLGDANLYRFSSKELHTSSGLAYYLYRGYDSLLQRWQNNDRLGQAGGFNTHQFAGNDPSDAVDPLGDRWYAPWTWFRRQPGLTLAPLDSGGIRVDVSRSELEQKMSPSRPLPADVLRNLDRGCVGLTCAYQGLGAFFPEQAPGTQCYFTESEAQARQCGRCDRNFVFAKQGQWANGWPARDPATGQIPTSSISNEGGLFNYVTTFPGTDSYAWMNNGAYPGAPPQRGRIAPFYPNDPHYPNTIWCSTCVKK